MACVVAWCFEFDCSAIVVRHVIPLLIMNYWLVMVTYLQHHEADTKASGERAKNPRNRKETCRSSTEVPWNERLPLDACLVLRLSDHRSGVTSITFLRNNVWC